MVCCILFVSSFPTAAVELSEQDVNELHSIRQSFDVGLQSLTTWYEAQISEALSLSAELPSWKQQATEQRQRAESLSIEVETWRQASTEARSEVQLLRLDLATARTSLQASETARADSERSTTEYVELVVRSRDAWMAIGLGAILAAVLGWLTAALT